MTTDRDASVVDVFERVASEHPGVVALALGDRSLTYRELDAASNRLAHRLRALDLGPEPRVAVAADRSIEAVVAFLGVLKAGGAFVPLDPENPPARIELIIGDTDAAAAVVQERFADRLRGRVRELVILDPELEILADEAEGRIAPIAAARDLAYVMYTSGSTGRPKGVAIEHRAIVRRVAGADELKLMPRTDEGMLQASALDFDAQTWEIWGALLNGARLVIAPPGRPDPDRIGATMREHEVAVALLSPGLFHQMVERDVAALGGLRLLLVGGDVLSPTHARRFVEAHPDCPLVNLYGPTEVTVCCSWHEVRAPAEGEAVPIGQPLGNTRLYVLGEDGSPAPPGEPGELFIGGDCVARGYLNLPAPTAERFLPDPNVSDPGARMYRSGDRVGLRGDGALDFIGRLDDQVKIRGFRVEPAEVEAHLQAAPGVLRAAVVAREDVPGHRRLVAYVVGDGTVADGTEHLRRHLEQRLPAHMVPSSYVPLDELPLTARGKVDRNALPAPTEAPDRRARLRPPRTPCEVALARIWGEVLHLEDVGVDDDFLELGGDSLLAIRVLVLVREALGSELPLDAVFQERTIGSLAARIEDAPAPAPALPPVSRVSRRADVPVSPMQAQACLAGELAVDALPYQFQALIHFDGALRVGALGQALTELVQRHEILHTRFPKRSGTWWQVVDAPFAVTLTPVDLRHHDDPRAALERLAAEAYRIPIAADRLPLTRWTLVRVADDRHVLVHVEHHLVHDGWSWAVFLRELVELYRAAVEGRPPRLPEPPLQFRDFTVWQTALVDSDLGRGQLAYWSRRLTDLPPPLELPYDRPRPVRQTYRGDQLVLELPADLARRLGALGRDHGVTLFMTMLAAFLVLLRRYSGQTDLVVGSGVSNRRLRETEDLIGMVLNTVALRTDLSGDPTVAELLERVRAVTLEAFAHQDVPFEQVVAAVAPERRPGSAPVYQVLFSFQDPPVPDLRVPGLTIAPDDTPGNGSAKADLNVVVINRRRAGAEAPGPGQLTVIWEYATDLFDADTAARMLGSYGRLLEALVEEPTLRVSELPLLTASTRRRLLEEAGRPVGYERDASAVDVFEARVREDSEAVALVADGTELSYGDLDRRANRIAHRLVGLGAGPGSRVGVLLDRSPDTVATLLAILKSGGAYVALDPALPERRLELLLEATAGQVVCTIAGLRERLPANAPTVVCIDAADLASEPDSSPRIPIGPRDPAYVAFTSGSTGAPRGVEVPHRAVVRLVRGTDYVDLDPSETLLAMAPLGFDASTFEIWGALLNGARLAVAPPGQLSPHEIVDALERYGVTTLWLTAGLFHRFVDHCPDGLRRIRQLVAGGDVLSPDHVNRALRLLPEDGVLVNGYGPTEGTTFTCCHRMPAGARVTGAVPIGRPIANTRVYVLDEHGAPVPPGVPGELYIGGDGVALGYLGRPDLTAERFVPDPFGTDPDARLYRSGDIARWRSDGVVEFLGRRDDQVKIRGFRVEPGEVEHALSSHPAVREAAVVARRYDPDDLRLVAYVVPVSGELPSDMLRAFLVERLPAHLVPTAFVTLARLPLTPNGKLDRGALPAPDGPGRPPAMPPRSQSRLEQRMTEVWEQVLGVSPVRLDDDFFDLGGHSLLAVELFAAIERVIGPRLPLAAIFEAPTVEQLAERVRREGWEAPWSSLVALNPVPGSRPPFFCVSAGDGNTVGYGALARHMRADGPFYALQPRGLDGRRPLQTRLETMARHHVRAIRSVQGTGPYLLGGRCLGGIVAYEMARQLAATGHEVALVAVLDSLGPSWTQRRLANGMVFDEVMNLALLRARAAGEDFGDVFTVDGTAAFLAWLRGPAVRGGDLTANRYLYEAYLARPDVQAAYPDLEGGDVARLLDWGWVSGRPEMGMTEELLPPPTPAAGALRRPRPARVSTLAARVATSVGDGLDVVTRGRLRGMAARRERRLQQIAASAASSYRAGPYAGRVTLIRSEEFMGDIEIARWHGVDTGGIDEHLVRGTHRSMLREPDVAALAECMEDCIDAALDDAGRTAGGLARAARPPGSR